MPNLRDEPKRRSRRWLLLLVAAILAVAALLWLLMPSPIDAVAYRAPASSGLQGPFQPNTALRSARVVGQGQLQGAEDVAVDPQGRLYTGTADGRVVRVTLRPGGGDILETYAETGGRPLGVRFGPDQRTLFVADANQGLLAVDPAGKVRTLATAAAGVPFRFTNDLDVAPDGTIYFSDSSSRFGIADYLDDLLEARPHGRLLAYGKDGGVRVLLDGLTFANGVALSRDGDFVLVNETYRYRIRRYWLAGPRQGTSDVFLDRLPGFPDNLSRDPATGHFWVALYTVRNPALDFLHPRPWLKDQLAKLPRLFWPKPEPYGLVFEVDTGGRVLRSLQDPGGQRVSSVTSVEPWGDSLYLGSLYGPLAVWSSPQAP
jgi:sugar lactone lactonase YvrE